MSIQVFTSHRGSDGLMEDYCDGADFAKHPLFSMASDPPALQIQLYYDDIDVCNQSQLFTNLVSILYSPGPMKKVKVYTSFEIGNSASIARWQQG